MDIDDINIKKFSELSGNDLRDLLNFIHSYYLTYRGGLGINKNITYGIEIEFESLKKSIVKKYLEENEIKWKIQADASVKSGGEISSKILHDNVKCWENLKNICDFLKNNGATTINGTTGGHIHIGAQIFETYENYDNFIKCYILYEDILSRFFCNEYINPRNDVDAYAVLSRKMLLKHNTNYKIFSGRYVALHDSIISYDTNFEENTLEFRRPNGTLEEVIWQNNINAVIKMILSIKDINFDIEYVKYEFNKYKTLCEIDNAFDYQINLKKVLKFVDLFFKETKDKIYFLRQYLKDYELSCNYDTLIKTKKFWK